MSWTKIVSATSFPDDGSYMEVRLTPATIPEGRMFHDPNTLLEQATYMVAGCSGDLHTEEAKGIAQKIIQTIVEECAQRADAFEGAAGNDDVQWDTARRIAAAIRALATKE